MLSALQLVGLIIIISPTNSSHQLPSSFLFFFVFFFLCTLGFLSLSFLLFLIPRFSFSIVSYFFVSKKNIWGDIEIFVDFQQQTVKPCTTITVAGTL